MVGLLVGSFIATVVTRFPGSESPLRGRSRCDHCGAPVSAPALIPLISYAVLRGRARCCNAPIDPIHPVAESAAALIGGIGALLPAAHAVAAVWFGWVLLTLALIDLRCFRLPNPMVALLAVTGFGASLLPGAPTAIESLLGMLAGYAALQAVRLLYRRARQREGIGSGDPKLLAAIGLWLGWQPLPAVLLIGSVAGLIWAGCMRLAGRPIALSHRMPLGTLLAIAAWPVWLWWIAGPLR